MRRFGLLAIRVYRNFSRFHEFFFFSFFFGKFGKILDWPFRASQVILDQPRNRLIFSCNEKRVVNRTLFFPFPECYEHIENDLGNVVVVVNNAACFDDTDWKKLIDTNLVFKDFF